MSKLKLGTYTKNKNALSKVVGNYGKPSTQKRLKRVVSNNKVAVIGVALATVATGLGVAGTILLKTRKRQVYQDKINELQTENERLEAILMSMASQGNQSTADALFNRQDSEDYGIDFPYTEDEVVVIDESFVKFTEGVADSLEKEGDLLAPQYKPNETITYSEVDFLNGLSILDEATEAVEEEATGAVEDTVKDTVEYTEDSGK